MTATTMRMLPLLPPFHIALLLLLSFGLFGRHQRFVVMTNAFQRPVGPNDHQRRISRSGGICAGQHCKHDSSVWTSRQRPTSLAPYAAASPRIPKGPAAGRRWGRTSLLLRATHDDTEQESSIFGRQREETTPSSSSSSSRREAFSSLLSSSLVTVAGVVSSVGILGGDKPIEAVVAFPNKISDKYDDRPKRRGPKPKDLGISKRFDMASEEYIGLKPCGPSPNCFCSTDNTEDDPDHSIPPFTWPSSLANNNPREAFEQLVDVLQSYEPGHDNIDGGGFQLVTIDVDKGYIYVQYESLKNGYIDDLELAYIPDYDEDGGGADSSRSVQVRSSSRVGYLDLGVNAKRINYIAKKLRGKGWDAVGVDPKTHQGYFIENQVV